MDQPVALEPVNVSQQETPLRSGRPPLIKKHSTKETVQEVVQFLKDNGGINSSNLKAAEERWNVDQATARRWFARDGVRFKNGRRSLLSEFDETVLFQTIDKLNDRGDPVPGRTMRALVCYCCLEII